MERNLRNKKREKKKNNKRFPYKARRKLIQDCN